MALVHYMYLFSSAGKEEFCFTRRELIGLAVRKFSKHSQLAFNLEGFFTLKESFHVNKMSVFLHPNVIGLNLTKTVPLPKNPYFR